MGRKEGRKAGKKERKEGGKEGNFVKRMVRITKSEVN